MKSRKRSAATVFGYILRVLVLMSNKCYSKNYENSDLRNIIFPFQINHRNETNVHRQLVVRATDPDPKCPKCQGMVYCNVLNGYMVEEVYVSKQYFVDSAVQTVGTCSVLEALGKRMYGEIFGKGKPFNDDSQCRQMVMEYLCLFWGTDNYMYRNSCIHHEDTTSANPADHKLTQRYPCRSFCIQVFNYYLYSPLLLC